MGAASALSIGLGLGRPPAPIDGWSLAGALLDADFVHRRYRHDGAVYGDEARFLSAVGGSRSGAAVTIGPTAIGPELLVNGGFDADVSGWAGAVSPAGNADPEWVGPGKLQVTVYQQFNRFARDVAATVGKAYRFGARPSQSYLAGGANIILGAVNLGGAQGSLASPFAAGELYLGCAAATAATMFIGVATSGLAPRTEQWDDFTVREAVPVAGHNHLALAGRISGTTPATASGNKVLLQADDAARNNNVPSEQNRVRIAWGADRHLRLIVTRSNVEQANLDLGMVEAATAFAVCFSATANEFKASLDGYAIVRDVSGLMPAIAAWRIGRSNTGEAWDGTIDRVTLFPAALADADMVEPARAFAIHGDSTARGDTGTVGARWWELLATGYAPARYAYNAGVSGQGAAAMRDGLLADVVHRGWTTIIMDRPSGGESGPDCVAAIKASVARLKTGRWFVAPPVDNSPEAAPDSSGPTITHVQQALLADPFFAGHSFDAAAQAAYLTALVDEAMRSDGIHFSDAGQAVQANHIRTWLDARGW